MAADRAADAGGSPSRPATALGRRMVDAGGLHVHLAQAGPPDAPTVLLLHGWPQTHRAWRHVVAPLGRDHRLLMPDLRGFGATDAPGHGMDPETFAADQVALLDALGIERVALIGHDWGGYTGFLLAARHPDRISAYLACSTPHPWLRPSPAAALRDAWRAWYAVALASPLGPALLRRGDVVRRVLSADTHGVGFSTEDLDAFADALRPPQRARATQLLYRSYLRAGAGALRGGDPVPRLTIPAHLLFGRRDRAIPRAMVADFPGVEFVDSGHFILDERPDLVAQRARDVFARAED
jgi:pimeloyl-ACP methyl ester carboxylesterase